MTRYEKIKSMTKENAENKPSPEQTAWVFKCILDNYGGSFDELIYDIMEYEPSDYPTLYKGGGMAITNNLHIGYCDICGKAEPEVVVHKDCIDGLWKMVDARKSESLKGRR